MECDIAIANNNPFLPTTSPPPPPVYAPSNGASPSPQRSSKDECFSCKRQGHWAKDCPSKNPKKSTPSSPSSSTPVRCPCGRGNCRVKTSMTQKNPDRDFYSCYSSDCRFFKWCDELSKITSRAPMCPCGVGICSVNGVSTGPNKHRWYFACRIKKNHGACEFFQWADSEVNTMIKTPEGESKEYSSLQSRFSAAMNDLDKNDMSSENEESPLVPNSENSLNLPNTTLHSDQVIICNADLVMQEAESNDSMTRNEDQVFQPMDHSQNLFQKVSWKQTSVLGNTVTEGIFPNFDPVRCSENVNIYNNEGRFLLPHRVLSAESDMPTLRASLQDARLSDAVFPEPSRQENHSGIIPDSNVSPKSILKTFGQSLFDILESINPPDSIQMLKVAESTLIAFQRLSIDCGPFAEAVKDYIHNISVLTAIEGSINEGPSYEALIKRHESEKVRFDDVSHLHTEAEAAYSTSENHLQSLQEEVSRVKGILVQLEKQLVACEAETALLKARANEVSEDVAVSKRSMDAAYSEMETASELKRQREYVRDAAGVALETARIWLEEH
ncbi:uncharacterized protein LOC126682366 isoform X2 [Mercurialis annua]|uniref:uncharacterized protein LOC126682366 isoform X2 n=1 Tax=Mercurialis annua TaxID=3986 RepID=UPI0021609244|nr:uncharacterized protein LOC126682366 isoform X2 [Mercurialis annua]